MAREYWTIRDFRTEEGLTTCSQCKVMIPLEEIWEINESYCLFKGGWITSTNKLPGVRLVFCHSCFYSA